MVKYFIVVSHPEPKSFNMAMFHGAVEALTKAGHEVKTTNLYEAEFDPRSSRKNFTTTKNPDFLKLQIEEAHASEHHGFAPDVEAELQKLEWCDVLIFQFPLWWFALPAPLKGWVDRVFVAGRAYGGGKLYENGVFKGKKAILSFTTGGPEAAYAPGGFNGDINGILRPIHRGVFEFCGFSVLAPNPVYSAAHGTDDDRRKKLEEWQQRVVKLHEEKPIVVGIYQ
jgi:NAD(P)H dehydrogenase (quinone)